MTEKIELGRISSRGQICIPNDIRKDMGLKEGSKVLFVLADDSLLVKKVDMKTFAEITRPLKEAKEPFLNLTIILIIILLLLLIALSKFKISRKAKRKIKR